MTDSESTVPLRGIAAVPPAFIRAALERVTHVDSIVQSSQQRFAAIVRPGGTSRGLQARVILGDSESVRTIHIGPVTALAWSADGERLALATGGAGASRIRLWTETTQQSTVIPAEMPGVVEQLAWRGDELVALVAPLDVDAAVGAGAARYFEADTVHDHRPGDGARSILVIGRDLQTTTPVLTDLGTIWEFELASSGRFIAIASDDPTESGWYCSRLVVIDPEQPETRTIHRSAWQLSCPRVSPDGERIALIEGWASDRGFLAGAVVTVDFDGMPTGRVIETGGADVTGIQWRDGDTIWLTGWTGMHSVHGWTSAPGATGVDLCVDASSAVRRIAFPLDSRGSLFASVQDQAGDTTLAVTRPVSGSWTSLHDPETAGRPAGRSRPLTVDSVTWSSERGPVIEGVVIRSADRLGPLPLVVHIHGGPANLWTSGADAAAVILAEAGFAVLRPNPRGSVGRGHDFATANLEDPAGGELRDITAGVAHCIAQGWAEPGAVFATGGSYGGYLTSCLAIFTEDLSGAAVASGHPDLISARYGSNNPAFYDRLVGKTPSRGDIDLWAERSPVLAVTRSAAPTLVLHGEADRCTPVGQAHELYRALRDASVDTTMVLYPGEGHGLRDLENQVDSWSRIIDWFRGHLETTG